MNVVHDLGDFLDAELSMRDHVARNSTHMFLSFAQIAVSPSSAWPRRHSVTRLSLRFITARSVMLLLVLVLASLVLVLLRAAL